MSLQDVRDFGQTMKEIQMDSIETTDMSTRLSKRRLGPLSLAEAAGSLGGVGIFLPLWLGMVTVCCIHPGNSLIVMGAANMAAGLAFGIPMPVQPLKAIAAAAIGSHLGQGEVAAASFSVGMAMLLLTSMRGFNRLHARVPVPLVRGVQWAVALQLALAGMRMLNIAGPQRIRASERGLWWAAIGLAVLLLLRASRRPSGAMIVLLLGLIGAAAMPSRSPSGFTSVGEFAAPIVPTAAEWYRGLSYGAVPMTALNSVLAVCAFAWSRFPQHAGRVTPRAVAVSTGLMNLIAAPLCGMPICHGAATLSAQHACGARSGTSTVLRGAAMAVAGLVVTVSATRLPAMFPQPLLGAWIITVAVELVRHTPKMSGRALTVALLVPIAVAVNVPLALAAGGAWLTDLVSSRLWPRLEGARLFAQLSETAGAAR